MTPLVRPPGPRNRGITGNFPLGSRDPLGLYTQWARQYGDIFYYRVFSRHIYFLNHPDLVEYVLVTNCQNFIKGEALQFNRRIFGNGLLTNDGASWSQQRHLIQPAFQRSRIESYGNIMVAYTERMMATWYDGEMRDIHTSVRVIIVWRKRIVADPTIVNGVGHTEVIQKRRSRKSGLAQKPPAPNFPQPDFRPGIISGLLVIRSK